MSFTKDRVLPLIIFPALVGIASNLLFGRLLRPGIDPGLNCNPPFQVTGVQLLDKTLCPVIEFFLQPMNDPVGQPFLSYALGTALPLIFIPAVEAYRPGQSVLLKYPMLWMSLTQLISAALTFPLYWLTFILTGGPRKVRQGWEGRLGQAEVLSLAFGLSIGVIIPTIAMLTMADPTVTAFWQFYPLVVALSQFIHLKLRPSSPSQSTSTAPQILFFACFILSSSIHISNVWPMLSGGNPRDVMTILSPSMTPLNPDLPLVQHFLDFLRWDILFSFVSMIVASFWFADTINQGIFIAVWYLLSIPILGFGAAVMGIALWRNGFL